MPTSRVTVAVLTYNRARYLRETLAGIVRQAYPAEFWDLLVIDHNSTDGTQDAVASFMASPPAPRRIVETAQGLDHGRNRAIAEARGDILVLVDDDILVEADWLPRPFSP